ncbi:MAG: glycosyltransferase [Pseudomonadota bacterium]
MLALVFASYNGAAHLPKMLAALRAIDRPADLRIIAVDNRSTDGTREVLEECRDDLALEILHEPAPGKNRALNRALAHLLPDLKPEDLVVFSDDDVLPSPDWLKALAKGADAAPDSDFFGGTIEPVWPAPPPAWLCAIEEEHGMLYARVSAPAGPCPAATVWGPNMAVRAWVFMAGHRYDEAVGPDGSAKYAMGSEAEFLRRIERAGYRGRFVPGAVVGHMVRPHQMERAWVTERARRAGLGSDACLTQARKLPLIQLPAWPVIGLMRARWALLAAGLRRDEVAGLRARMSVNWHSGVIERMREIGPGARHDPA